MVLVALAPLDAEPVHKEAKLLVHHQDRNEHVNGDADRCKARKEPSNERYTTEELSCDSDEGQGCRNVKAAGEELQASMQAVTSEPAEHQLRAVGEEDHPEHQPEHRDAGVVVRCESFANHP